MTSVAGGMRHRITFYRADETAVDSGGNPTTGTPTNLGTRWANIKPIAGREFLSADQVHAESTHMVTLRNDSLSRNLTPKDWIEWGTRIFEISTVPDYGFFNRNLVVVQVEETIKRTTR